MEQTFSMSTIIPELMELLQVSPEGRHSGFYQLGVRTSVPPAPSCFVDFDGLTVILGSWLVGASVSSEEPVHVLLQ